MQDIGFERIDYQGYSLIAIAADGDSHQRAAGLFASQEHVFAFAQDETEAGIVPWRSLTADQQAIAARNSDRFVNYFFGQSETQ